MGETVRVDVKVADEVVDRRIGRGEHHPVVAQLEEVWAFLADVGGKAAIGPVDEIAGLGLPYRSADTRRAQNHEAPVPLEEEKGVAPPPVELGTTVPFERERRIVGVLRPVYEIVVADGGPLLERLQRIPALSPLLGAGVQDNRLAVFVEPGGAGIAACLSCLRGGPNRDRQVLPVDEVCAACVAPMGTISGVRVERIELVEDVVVAPMQEGAVHVVHPSRRRAEVVDGPRGIGGSLRGASQHSDHARLYRGVLVLHPSFRFLASWTRAQIHYHTRG